MKQSYCVRTEDDYKKCVDSLIKLVEKARGDSSGERTVRKFLLNLYNCDNPAVGFNPLDHENFKRCIDVLLLHRAGGREIHEYIQNGSQIFIRLWKLENPRRKNDG